MILYALRCADGHQFDAWFRNGDAYDAQAAAGDVLCPVCGSARVAKAPMAPRIGKSRAALEDNREAAAKDRREAAATEDDAAAPVPANEPQSPAETTVAPAEIRQALAALRAQVEARCDYVGERFPEEARRMHYNETPARPIYGEATRAEAEALEEEGVALRRIPWLPRSDS